MMGRPAQSSTSTRAAALSTAAGGPRVHAAVRLGWLGHLARHRIVHFLVAGGLIFAIAPAPDDRRDIAFESASLAALEAAQTARGGRPTLTAGETTDVRTRAIEDEILYREALRLGFDEHDNVVRQRLIQKMLFLAEDLAGVSRPATDDELRAFYETNRQQFTRPARTRLIHIYAGSARRDWLAGLRPDVIAANATAPDEPPAFGDAFALPRTVSLPRNELATQYGDAFADAVFALPLGEWSEPIGSKFGWHLVKVLRREASGPASFDDVRGQLPLFYLVARKQTAARDYIREAATRYHVTVDGQPITILSSSGRTAPGPVEEAD